MCGLSYQVHRRDQSWRMHFEAEYVARKLNEIVVVIILHVEDDARNKWISSSSSQDANAPPG